MKCNFTFFQNAQGVCLSERECVCVCVYVCVCLGLCVLVCRDGRFLCDFECVCLVKETETEEKNSL
jgi:hypothetical protein